jgi:hypothetical protein
VWECCLGGRGEEQGVRASLVRRLFCFRGYGEKGAWMRRWLSEGVRSMSEAFANVSDEGMKRGVKRASFIDYFGR